MGVTSDRNDPRLGHGADNAEGQEQNEVYLVMSDEERKRGFVRPVLVSYVHDKCGAVTKMGQAIAETYAADPSFYGSTYCTTCGGHYAVGADGEFRWINRDGTTGSKVGT